MPPDPVPPEVRAAERDIDSAYRSNPLVQLSIGEAAWYFLAFCEDRLLSPVLKACAGREEMPNDHQQAALADHVMNHAKWPLRWLWQICPRGPHIPQSYCEDAYKAAWDLSNLASEYLTFESAFTYASLRVATLRLENHKIVASGPFRQDTRYEAYDRIVHLEEGGERVDFDEIARLVGRSVQVQGHRFSYQLNPRTVREVMDVAGERITKRFHLPLDWDLGQYSLGQFAEIAKCIGSISAIHQVARLIAAMQGCEGLGYSRSLVVMGREELLRRLVRYSGLPENTVRSILVDMTYGAGGIAAPDPALQPIVPLTDSEVAWAPSLVLVSALERNLLVLLNRRPDARSVYLRLSTQKENLLRSRMMNALDGLGLRFWHGEVPGWGTCRDVDLAIISDAERCCLLLELKSFISPAEPREVHERSEEISRGISQISRRRLMATTRLAELCSVLDIGPEYALSWGVASETSIGAGWVQENSVPVIQGGHLVGKIVENRSLKTACSWLTNREYLPVEGRHYETVPVTKRIGSWTLDWHGIRGIEDLR